MAIAGGYVLDLQRDRKAAFLGATIEEGDTLCEANRKAFACLLLEWHFIIGWDRCRSASAAVSHRLPGAELPEPASLASP